MASNANIAFYPEQIKFKILFVGDSCVGKTSFISRYCEDVFNLTFIATVGIDLKIKWLERDNQVIKLELWDTAGQERYRCITPAMYYKANGIVVMFDLTNRQSYLNCQFWIDAISEATSDAVFVLVGNKLDLTQERAVSVKEAKEFASRRRLPYYECSIKECIGFDEVINGMIDELLKKRIRKIEDSILLTSSPDDSQQSNDDEKRNNKLSACSC